MVFDTIVAISSALGEGAIGIIRMSGSEAFEVLDQIFISPSDALFEDKKMVYGKIVKDGMVIDEVMATKMFAPRTYTRENLVEIYCHGGIVPMREILNLILLKGVRMANKGEFTQRAFLNGRIDLAQAESIMDLIGAKTKRGFDLAINQLEGHLSSKIKGLRSKLIALMAEVEVSIDYPEEDIEEITYPQIAEALSGVKQALEALYASSKSGRIIRDGLKTVIVGKPNVGKSSLMNALLKDSRAIVTEIPGTTRDVIEEFMNVAGIPIKLVDTAGIRETDDVVEKIGVEKSKRYFNDADLIIFVLNASEPLSEEDLELMDLLKDKHAIVIINKTDLPIAIDEAHIQSVLQDKRIIRTSVHHEIGIDDIENAITHMILGSEVSVNQNELVTNARHASLLEVALKNVTDAIEATQNGLPYDFIEVDIKNAIEHLGNITGESVEEDLLNNIFGNFCLGK